MSRTATPRLPHRRLYAGHYESSRAAATEGSEGLMSFTQIDCERVMFKIALPFFTDHPKLSFKDRCMGAYAELSNDAPLWTFDRKLAGQARWAQLRRHVKCEVVRCATPIPGVKASPPDGSRHVAARTAKETPSPGRRACTLLT